MNMEMKKRDTRPVPLAITIPQSCPSREVQEELSTSRSFLMNACHSEGGCFWVVLSQLLLVMPPRMAVYAFSLPPWLMETRSCYICNCAD